jgi:hypothetical protein
VPPRKRAAAASPPVPSDREITDAIKSYRELEAAYRVAYSDMMQAREQLVSVLRAAGLDSLTMLR